MQSLEMFMSRLLPQVIGCPTPLANQALVDAAIEFCDESQVVQLTTEPMVLSVGLATYDVELPRDTGVSRVLRAWVGAYPLILLPNTGQLSPRLFYPDVGDGTQANGTPRHAFVTEPLTVTLYPPPDASVKGKLTLRVATRPLRKATSLDDDLLFSWAEAVTNGAVFRLASMPGQPFTDTSLASTAHSRFWLSINRARIEANRGRVGGSSAITMRPFA